jgi:hypothetical protein
VYNVKSHVDTATSDRVAARVQGPGPALAVRPAGLAKVSGAQGWVPEIVSAERLETISGALDAGGASPDDARRTGPSAVTFSRLPAHSARH